MGEAEGEENSEYRRNPDCIRLDLVDAGRRAVRWCFTRGPHRHTVNALGLGSENRGARMVNGGSTVAAALSRRVPFKLTSAFRRPTSGVRLTPEPKRFVIGIITGKERLSP